MSYIGRSRIIRRLKKEVCNPLPLPDFLSSVVYIRLGWGFTACNHPASGAVEGVPAFFFHISTRNLYFSGLMPMQYLYPLKGTCQENSLSLTRRIFLAGTSPYAEYPTRLSVPLSFLFLWLAVSSAPCTHRDIRSLSSSRKSSVPCQSNR